MKILYADDDPDDVLLFCEALKVISPSTICSIARDGKEALELLHSEPEKPNVIFLDINMPIMDGRETLQNIRKSKHLKDIPVVIYSTHVSKEAISSFNQLGVREFVTKPTSFEALCDSLKQVIRIYRN